MQIRPVFLQELLARVGLHRADTPYIRGSDTLPLPLSPEEEAYYIRLLANGDTNARQVLIERNLRFVVYISRRYENTGIDIEDLISIGTIGLVKAVETFKVEKNIKFATYTSRCITNEILMYLRKTKKLLGEVSFDEPITTDSSGDELSISDILSTEYNSGLGALEEHVDKALLIQALEILSEHERKLIVMRYGLDGAQKKTQKEVAELMGLSQAYISRLEKRIILKLKREISKHL